jgi:hypothetical protein
MEPRNTHEKRKKGAKQAQIYTLKMQLRYEFWMNFLAQKLLQNKEN